MIVQMREGQNQAIKMQRDRYQFKEDTLDKTYVPETFAKAHHAQEFKS